MRAALLENARFRYHTSLELWKQYDFRARCCWSRAGPVKNATFMECIALTANECCSFRCQTCLGLQAGPPCRLFVGSARKPGSESIRRVSVGLHPKIKPETFLVGSEAYTQRPFVELRVKASDVFLCGLHPKMRPRGFSGGLQDLQTGSESIKRAFSSLKMIPRDRLCGL